MAFGLTQEQQQQEEEQRDFAVCYLIEVVHLPLVRVELARLVTGHGDYPALVDPKLEIHLLNGGPSRSCLRDRLPREPAAAGVVPEVSARAV